ncbi:hypothetical protein [Nocardia tengchongensis]|uniref:hypothetical protein n=1 Tax=Nocardia tengchongensis TaxID=2055889 RepID=UPI0036213F37
MNKTEARVMRALAPGEQRTIDQIACDARISTRSAQNGVRSLAAKGFAVGSKGLQRNAWMPTSAGAGFVTGGRGRALLDIPEG